jgi:hypothetical protein
MALVPIHPYFNYLHGREILQSRLVAVADAFLGMIDINLLLLVQTRATTV